MHRDLFSQGDGFPSRKEPQQTELARFGSLEMTLMRISVRYNLSELLEVSQRLSLAWILRQCLFKEQLSERNMCCAYWKFKVLPRDGLSCGMTCDVCGL